MQDRPREKAVKRGAVLGNTLTVYPSNDLHRGPYDNIVLVELNYDCLIKSPEF